MNQHQREWLKQKQAVRVMPFSAEECPFDKAREHTWREWHSFRNQVLDILSQYGTVGQLGKLPILETYEESKNAWGLASKKPDFFVVDDDMYGNSVRVEGEWRLVRPAILDELLMLLIQWKDWSVYLALRTGGLWVFHDRILTEGDPFAGCHSVNDIYLGCSPGAPSAPN